MDDSKISALQTTRQADDLSVEIDHAIAALYKDGTRSEHEISTQEESLQNLQKKIDALPTVEIILAQEPNEKVLTIISNWLSDNLQKQVLINLEVDPQILGGAKVVWQGKYQDQSVKTKLDNYFESIRL